MKWTINHHIKFLTHNKHSVQGHGFDPFPLSQRFYANGFLVALDSDLREPSAKSKTIWKLLYTLLTQIKYILRDYSVLSISVENDGEQHLYKRYWNTLSTGGLLTVSVVIGNPFYPNMYQLDELLLLHLYPFPEVQARDKCVALFQG